MQMRFTVDCRHCSRLAGFLDEVKACYPDYYARPVPAFGDVAPELLIIGLAPGMHGANRTGRPFTGDFAGILLYQTLYKFGFATHEGSASANDNLELMRCRITNAVKCLPPGNKPEPGEIRQCNRYLAEEISEFAASRIRTACSWRYCSSGCAHGAGAQAQKLSIQPWRDSHASRRGFGWHTEIHS